MGGRTASLRLQSDEGLDEQDTEQQGECYFHSPDVIQVQEVDVKYTRTQSSPLEVSSGSQVLILLAQAGLGCIFDPAIPSSADDRDRDTKGVHGRNGEIEH